MKAAINAYGSLVVWGETAIEIYALKCWHANYFGDSPQKNTELVIRFDTNADPDRQDDE